MLCGFEMLVIKHETYHGRRWHKYLIETQTNIQVKIIKEEIQRRIEQDDL